jgi:hypothetical protein
MISASKGTKIKESETPLSEFPTSINGIDCGKSKSAEGPNINSETKHIMKAN